MDLPHDTYVAHLRHRHRARPVRPVPGARGQRPHAVGRVLRDREPLPDDAHLRGPDRRPAHPPRRPVRPESEHGADRDRAARHPRAAHRPAVARRVQRGLFRARVPGARARRAAGRGPRPAGRGRPRLHEDDHRPRARRRDLPAHRRRLPRPGGVPAGEPARRARADARLSRRQSVARQRGRHRRRRRQGGLRLHAADHPILPGRGSDHRQCRDPHLPRAGRPAVHARSPRRAGDQAGRRVRAATASRSARARPRPSSRHAAGGCWRSRRTSSASR